MTGCIGRFFSGCFWVCCVTVCVIIRFRACTGAGRVTKGRRNSLRGTPMTIGIRLTSANTGRAGAIVLTGPRLLFLLIFLFPVAF